MKFKVVENNNMIFKYNIYIKQFGFWDRMSGVNFDNIRDENGYYIDDPTDEQIMAKAKQRVIEKMKADRKKPRTLYFEITKEEVESLE